MDVNSYLSKENISLEKAIQAKNIRRGIFSLIQKDYPGFGELDYISLEELNAYRKKYLDNLIQDEREKLFLVDKNILETINTHAILSDEIQEFEEQRPTFGERIADKIASFGGSWTFILSFLSFILFWMLLNVLVLRGSSFDTYPFILLNLILSCIASLQAPIIMMSQNRQEKKDRVQSEYDYRVDKKAELEIRLINQKIDHLMVEQNKKLLEIQEVQIDYLDDLINSFKK